MQKKIFIVEDDEDISELVQMVVVSEGHEAIPFDDIDKMESMLGKKPDLIIMDLFIKGKDATSIARSLKKSKTTGKIPIILVSAKTSLAEIAKQCNVDAFLPKPFNLKDLKNLIAKLS